MTTIKENPSFKTLWSETQEWISSSLEALTEKDIANEGLVNILIDIAANAYYTNVEDYSPNTRNPLQLIRLEAFNQPIVTEQFLQRILAADKHGYATEEILRYQHAHN